MGSWTVDVISGAMAERLADPACGPLRRAGFAGEIVRVERGVLQLDDTAVMSLGLLHWEWDGHVTWDDGPVLHIGQDSHRLIRDAGRVF